MTKNNTTLKYRMGKVEKQVIHVIEKVDKIRTNDLPHITNLIITERGERKIENASVKSLVKAATVINVGAIVLGALILRYL